MSHLLVWDDEVAVGHGEADGVDVVDRVHGPGRGGVAEQLDLQVGGDAHGGHAVGERDHVAAGDVRACRAVPGGLAEVDVVLGDQFAEQADVLVADLAGLHAHAQLGATNTVVGQQPAVGLLPREPAALDVLDGLGPVAELAEIVQFLVRRAGQDEVLAVLVRLAQELGHARDRRRIDAAGRAPQGQRPRVPGEGPEDAGPQRLGDRRPESGPAERQVHRPEHLVPHQDLG